jgi:hypothetical protein
MVNPIDCSETEKIRKKILRSLTPKKRKHKHNFQLIQESVIFSEIGPVPRSAWFVCVCGEKKWVDFK